MDVDSVDKKDDDESKLKESSVPAVPQKESRKRKIDSGTCCICMDYKESVYTYPCCETVVCKPCMETWKKSGSVSDVITCPECKRDLTATEIRFLFGNSATKKTAIDARLEDIRRQIDGTIVQNSDSVSRLIQFGHLKKKAAPFLLQKSQILLNKKLSAFVTRLSVIGQLSAERAAQYNTVIPFAMYLLDSLEETCKGKTLSDPSLDRILSKYSRMFKALDTIRSLSGNRYRLDGVFYAFGDLITAESVEMFEDGLRTLMRHCQFDEAQRVALLGKIESLRKTNQAAGKTSAESTEARSSSGAAASATDEAPSNEPPKRRTIVDRFPLVVGKCGKCSGVVKSFDMRCLKCNTLHCVDCRASLNEPSKPAAAAAASATVEDTPEPMHVCDHGDTALVKRILDRNSKMTVCPGCGVDIYRYAGCPHMFCVRCNKRFDFTTQQSLSDILHVPDAARAFLQGRLNGPTNGRATIRLGQSFIEIINRLDPCQANTYALTVPSFSDVYTELTGKTMKEPNTKDSINHSKAILKLTETEEGKSVSTFLAQFKAIYIELSRMCNDGSNRINTKIVTLERRANDTILKAGARIAENVSPETKELIMSSTTREVARFYDSLYRWRQGQATAGVIADVVLRVLQTAEGDLMRTIHAFETVVLPVIHDGTERSKKHKFVTQFPKHIKTIQGYVESVVSKARKFKIAAGKLAELSKTETVSSSSSA